MTNVGTVVLIGIIYALDVCYIALTCSPMTLLELQLLLVYHNDRTWLSWTVPRCMYDIPRSDMTVWDMYRTIYALDANYIASACSPMTPLDLQQLFICHNDHMWLYWTVPYCIYTISRPDMTYGDSLGQCVCRLWYGITSWNSSINI